MSRAIFLLPPRRSQSVRAVAFALLASGSFGCEPKANENDTVGALFRALCETNARCAGADAEEIDCSPENFCFYPGLEADMGLHGAHRCAKELAELDCDAYVDDAVPSACELALLQVSAKRGLSGLDGPCHSDADCHPDLLCSAGDDGEACGVCTPFPVAGERCRRLRLCGSGAHCGDDGRCHADAGRGEACADSSDCKALLSCIEGACEPNNLREGDACGEDVEGRCAGFLLCQEGRCQPRPKLGEACSTLGCSTGLVCVDHTCVEPAACGEGQLGDPCYANVCAPGLDCDPFSSTCTEREARGAIGDACDGNGECETDVCSDGRCAENSCRVGGGNTQKAAPRAAKPETTSRAAERHPLDLFGARAR